MYTASPAILSNFFGKTVNSKPPTVPFEVVACTLSDNLSRNIAVYGEKLAWQPVWSYQWKKGDPAKTVTFLLAEPTLCFSSKRLAKSCKEMLEKLARSPRGARAGESPLYLGDMFSPINGAKVLDLGKGADVELYFENKHVELTLFSIKQFNLVTYFYFYFKDMFGAAG